MLMSELPDIASELRAEKPSPLQWVGMEDIAVPVSVEFNDENKRSLPAKVKVFVSLDEPDAKGIHMSRLHNVVNQLAGSVLNEKSLERSLSEVIESQNGIGRSAKIEVAFDVLLSKPALLSDEIGYQSYPVKIVGEMDSVNTHCEFELTIPYSSTCPCSASLARQLRAEAVDREFPKSSIDKADLLQWLQSNAGSVATPHSQRSYATIRFVLAKQSWPDLPSLILRFEDIIGTPVQTAVKRSDEQAFAKLNAENLMFCEDAARRIKFGLESMDFVKNYWFKVEHQESLHAHNAVVIDQNNDG